MQNTSTAFRNELNNDNRRYIKTCTITLVDGTVLSIDNSKIWSNGFKVENAVSGDSSFDIGAAIIGKFTLIINNIYDDYSDYDFTGAAISNVRTGLEMPNSTVESVKMGIFTVDEARYNGSIITLECLDNMTRFDQPYTLSKLTYPATLGAIVRDACSCCGVSLAADSATFEMDDFVVDARPDDKTTFREVLSWVGQISCHWCRCNVNGQLSLGWYDQGTYEGLQITDAGTLAAPAADKIDAGTFLAPAAEVIDAGNFSDRKAFHHIYSLSSMTISTDDVVITGIRVVEKSSGDGEEDTAYQTGEDGYVLTIEDNKLIQGKGQEVAAYLGRKLIGLRFRPLSVSCLSDPSIEAGDIAYVTDRKGRSYATLITSTTFQAGNYQQIACSAESPARNSASRYSKYTKVYEELQRKLSRNKTEWQKAIEQLDQRLSTSSGLYSTIDSQADGSSIYYLHDKPALSESKIVWKMTAEAWGVSTDGGETWNGGMTVDGEVIARILTSIGINADWINTGALVIRDADGNILLNADVDTGRVDIVADSFSLRGKTIEEMAQNELNDFINAVYGPDLEEIQAQIDGQIETYYYDYEPSLQNIPASQWTTTKERKRHIGDLFYWKSTGYAYRFLQDGAAWKWQIVQDTDITKALAAAESAQDTADGKRRVFVVTPQPPYDIGDLWAQGSTGDLMRCKVARSSGGYTSTDWEKASKYTDDTKADQAITMLQDKSGNYYGSYAPTLSNSPASSWNTSEYSSHDGDVFFNPSTGDVYVFRYGTTSRWTLLPKVDAQEIVNQLDQETIFNVLTNNGQTQGIVLSGGRIYINGEYIRSNTVSSTALEDGSVTETKIKGGSVTTNKLAAKAVTAEKIDVTNLNALAAYIGKWSIGDNLEASSGNNTLRMDAQNARIYSMYGGSVIPVGGKGYAEVQGSSIWADYLQGVDVTAYRFQALRSASSGAGAYIEVGASLSNMSFSVDDAGHSNMKLPTVTGGYPLVAVTTATNGMYPIRKNSSSSKRYKSIRKMVKTEEIESLYSLPVNWFVYKDGYLDEQDERYGVEIPGFIAEELESRLPVAVNHIDGKPENWNETIMVPCLLKLIQDQKKELDALKNRVEAMNQELSQIKQMSGGAANGN